MKRIFTLLFGTSILTAVFAQSLNKMSYQAIVRDANDNLVKEQSVGMQISILQGSATGTEVYVEQHISQTNINGLIGIEIGGGTVISGEIATIDWSSGTYFLKTEIDINGGTNYSITGTSQFLSVPYAKFAEKSGDRFSGDYNDLTNSPLMMKDDTIVYSNKNNYFGIGTSNPKSQLTLRSNSNTVNSHSVLSIERNDGVSRLFLGQTKWAGQIAALNDLVFIADADNNNSGGTSNFSDFVWAEGGYFAHEAQEQMRLRGNGQLQINNNDVYLKNIGSGVILKSPNGNCFRVTVDNSGNLVSTAITCP